MRVKEHRSSYYSWPIFHDQAWAPSEFFQESCTDSSVQINELHPPGRILFLSQPPPRNSASHQTSLNVSYLVLLLALL